jgi:membrane protein YdbS with pleckstrin-like domain
VAVGVVVALLVRDLGAPAPWPVVVVGIAVALAVFEGLVAPRLRFRAWRYAVRDEELDLLRGTFTVVRTVVPVARIQHVETERTLVSRWLGLAAVHVHTAAGSNSIPYLREADAADIRQRLATLARVPDEL